MEVQKVEEILYQRSKYSNRNDYDGSANNDTPTTPIYNDEGYHEVQTISAYQINQRTKSNNERHLASNRNRNDYTTTRHPH